MRGALALLFLTSACGGVASSAGGGAGGVGGDAGGNAAWNSFGGISGSGASSGSGPGGAASGGNGFGGIAGSPNGGSSGTGSQVVCPSTTRGPALVPAGIIAGNGFCIDRTEVTEEQFSEFVRDVGAPSAVGDLLPAVCGFKKRFGPLNFRSASILPMRRVDWCDAATFCAWSGKRLCQAVGDPDYDYTPVITATNSEWFYACSNGGTQRFPWGNNSQPSACNARCDDNTCDLDGRERVATRSTCEGGIEGVYDLGGNQIE